MNVSLGSPPIHRRRFDPPFVISVVLALAIGALAGSLVTRSLDEGGVTQAPLSVEAASSDLVAWDAGKLEAMEGRMLAEELRVWGAGWDAGKLEAMEGRMRAEELRAE